MQKLIDIRSQLENLFQMTIQGKMKKSLRHKS